MRLATLDLVGAERLVVSDWGLREGILIRLGGGARVSPDR